MQRERLPHAHPLPSRRAELALFVICLLLTLALVPVVIERIAS
jgi:hypothetical protein